MGQLISFAFLILTFSAFPAYSFTGEVVEVMDGNTIELMHRGKAERIRLQGIDSPETSQAFATQAKQATSALFFVKTVTFELHGHDKYKRAVGTVVLADGTNLNRELVTQGWCWWYREYVQRILF